MQAKKQTVKLFHSDLLNTIVLELALAGGCGLHSRLWKTNCFHPGYYSITNVQQMYFALRNRTQQGQTTMFCPNSKAGSATQTYISHIKWASDIAEKGMCEEQGACF